MPLSRPAENRQLRRLVSAAMESGRNATFQPIFWQTLPDADLFGKTF
jgi:hypothetical protein